MKGGMTQLGLPDSFQTAVGIGPYELVEHGAFIVAEKY